MRSDFELGSLFLPADVSETCPFENGEICDLMLAARFEAKGSQYRES